MCGTFVRFTTKRHEGCFCIFIAWNSWERTGNYPNKQHDKFCGNLSRACEQTSPSRAPLRLNHVWWISGGMWWRLRPLRKFLHMQREGNWGRLVYRSSQVPPLIFQEHFNYTRICSHCNMAVSTWHRVNTCESWLYSEATVAAMPQGVAVWLVNTKFKKQPQIWSHQARSLLLGRVTLKQTENIFLPSHPLGTSFQTLSDKACHHHSCHWLRSSCMKLGRNNIKSILQKLWDNWQCDIWSSRRAADLLTKMEVNWSLQPTKIQTSRLQIKQSATALDTVQ